jgi:hypothetical protein
VEHFAPKGEVMAGSAQPGWPRDYSAEAPVATPTVDSMEKDLPSQILREFALKLGD